jgi:hypothetical protein
MKDEEIYDLMLDMVNSGELVMKDGKIYSPEHAPKEGVYIPLHKVKDKLSDETTEGN